MGEMTTEVKVADRRLVVREAEPRDEAQISARFEACTEYFEAATGLPPGPADVQSLYYGLPPGARWEDKRLYLLMEEGGEENASIGGILDVILRFPTADTCSVGLFLLHPSQWGMSVGTVWAGRMLEIAETEGIRRVTATAPRGWDRGHQFLTRLGFTITSAQQRAPRRQSKCRTARAGRGSIRTAPELAAGQRGPLRPTR